MNYLVRRGACYDAKYICRNLHVYVFFLKATLFYVLADAFFYSLYKNVAEMFDSRDISILISWNLPYEKWEKYKHKCSFVCLSDAKFSTLMLKYSLNLTYWSYLPNVLMFYTGNKSTYPQS